MTTLYEKLINLPPSLLPRVEHFVDSLPLSADHWDDFDWNGIDGGDPDWGPPPLDESGTPVHPKAGCMKGIIVMNDNFFEPDDGWEDYT